MQMKCINVKMWQSSKCVTKDRRTDARQSYLYGKKVIPLPTSDMWLNQWRMFLFPQGIYILLLYMMPQPSCELDVAMVVDTQCMLHHLWCPRHPPHHTLSSLLVPVPPHHFHSSLHRLHSPHLQPQCLQMPSLWRLSNFLAYNHMCIFNVSWIKIAMWLIIMLPSIILT